MTEVVMLSKEEQQEIDVELKHVPTKQAACIGALKIVQKHRDGWVSDDGIADIAAYLDMSREELDSVATFYNLIFRKPVGRNVILLCDSVSCWIEGYESIAEHLQKTLKIGFGETTDDGAFTLLPMPCIGLCDRAPAMIVGTTTYGNLTTEKVDRILQELR